MVSRGDIDRATCLPCRPLYITIVSAQALCLLDYTMRSKFNSRLSVWLKGMGMEVKPEWQKITLGFTAKLVPLVTFPYY